jgi:ABC-type branched-subunit amino acid transport system ATPase component
MIEKENGTCVLNVQSVSCGYRNRLVLHDMSLSVADNEHVALIGINGCGKSTLLRTIMNLVDTKSGKIFYRGHEITRLKPEAISAAGVGYLKQSENVFSHLTVRDNLLLAADWSKSDSARRDAVLSHFPAVCSQLDLRAGLLSGGQRQALAMAMILTRPIKLLLLDEPISGLSQSASVELLHSLESLREQYSFASIVVEHRLKRIHPFVNRVVVMREGRIVDDTTDTSRMLDAGWLELRYKSRHETEDCMRPEDGE